MNRKSWCWIRTSDVWFKNKVQNRHLRNDPARQTCWCTDLNCYVKLCTCSYICPYIMCCTTLLSASEFTICLLCVFFSVCYCPYLMQLCCKWDETFNSIYFKTHNIKKTSNTNNKSHGTNEIQLRNMFWKGVDMKWNTYMCLPLWTLFIKIISGNS